MPVSKDVISTAEAVRLAHTIAGMPRGEVPGAVRKMIQNRELYRTVSALDDLLSDYPHEKPIAARALDKLGLWNAG
jgi:hypothetical protein